MADHERQYLPVKAELFTAGFSFVKQVRFLRTRWLRILVLSILLGSLSAAQAAEFTRVRVGHQGVGRIGEWTHVEATANGLPPDTDVSLVVTSLDARGNRVEETCATEEVRPDGSARLTGLCRIGRPDASVTVTLTGDSGESICSRTIRCGTQPHTDAVGDVQSYVRLHEHRVPFLLTTGETSGIPELLTRANDASPDRPALVGLTAKSADELPRTSHGYDIFTTVVINGPIDLSGEQFQALKTWVHRGGHLIVSCGESVDELLATELGAWLNGRFEIPSETSPVTDTDLVAIQEFVPRSTRISTFRRTVRMSSVRSRQLDVLAESNNGPMIVRSGSGAGIITYVTVNLNERPMAQWKSLADLYALLILGEPVSRAISEVESARISSSGVTDLTTQLMASVDAHPRTGRWSTWNIMAMVFAWLLVVGPVDYFLVVILLKRPHLTWVTFPLWVAAGMASLFWLNSGNNQHTVLNAVHVIDVFQDIDESVMRSTSLMSLSFPQTGRRELRVEPRVVTDSPRYVNFSWYGRPENVYGGLYRTGGVGRGQEGYRWSADNSDTLAGVPVLADGSFEVRAQWDVLSKTPLLESSLNASGFGLLEGTLTHHLPDPIHDWILVYGSRVYRARGDERKSLPPGQPWQSAQQASYISDLKTYLGGRRDVRSEPRTGLRTDSFEADYNARSRDPLDIVTMMSLYETAGADSYTGLSHAAMSQMDLSDTVRMNYALLIGWTESRAVELKVDGERLEPDSSSTIVRLLLPVDRHPAQAQALTKSELEALQRDKEQPPPAAPEPTDSTTPAADDVSPETDGDSRD